MKDIVTDDMVKNALKSDAVNPDFSGRYTATRQGF
ncbi:hypothetical protein ACFK0O_004527 [Salmonella enterica]